MSVEMCIRDSGAGVILDIAVFLTGSGFCLSLYHCMGMIELGNYCAFFNHLIAVQAPFITGITLGFLSSGYSASYLGVDVIVGGKVAVLNSANLAFRFGMTCGFAADVGSYIELCTEIADMPMICTIGFPLPIRIYMLACSRRCV